MRKFERRMVTEGDDILLVKRSGADAYEIVAQYGGGGDTKYTIELSDYDIEELICKLRELQREKFDENKPTVS